MDIQLPPESSLPSAQEIYAIYRELRHAFARGIDMQMLWGNDEKSVSFRPDLAIDVRLEDNPDNWLETTLAIDSSSPAVEDTPTTDHSSVSSRSEVEQPHALVTKILTCVWDPVAGHVNDDEPEQSESELFVYAPNIDASERKDENATGSETDIL